MHEQLIGDFDYDDYPARIDGLRCGNVGSALLTVYGPYNESADLVAEGDPMGLMSTVVRDAKSTVDPANHSGAKFWLRVIARTLTSSQVLAVLVFRFSSALARTPLRPFAFLLRTLNVILFGTDIHPDAKIGPGLALVHSVGVVIGPCTIGENFRIGQGSTIGELGRGSRDAATVGRPTIGDDVTVGTNAVIIGKVLIGDLSVIGACSLVTKDVASGWVVGGVPARPLREVDPIDVFGHIGPQPE